jgi:outer membrane protein, multidrug efflux system
LRSKAAAPRGASREEREIEFYDASFDALWELDLFGRVRRSVQAANAQLASVEADRLDVLVSVAAEVARNYFELRGFQNQLAVARRNAEVQSKTFQLTKTLHEGGRGTAIDISRSRSLLNLTLSTIPPLEAAIQKSIHRISVLTGQHRPLWQESSRQPNPYPP